MSDNIVHVPFGDNMAETATLLLAAAEETKNDPNVVFVDHFTNSYQVPEDVAKKAGLDSFDPDAEFQAQVEAVNADDDLNMTPPESDAEAEPAKKTAAKKTAAKKS